VSSVSCENKEVEMKSTSIMAIIFFIVLYNANITPLLNIFSENVPLSRIDRNNQLVFRRRCGTVTLSLSKGWESLHTCFDKLNMTAHGWFGHFERNKKILLNQ
jgi:hypothetical protein